MFELSGSYSERHKRCFRFVCNVVPSSQFWVGGAGNSDDTGCELLAFVFERQAGETTKIRVNAFGTLQGDMDTFRFADASCQASQPLPF